MLSTITFLIITLVLLNFMLLAFSCNKTKKHLKALDKNKGVVSVIPTKTEVSSQLAPTGS